MTILLRQKATGLFLAADGVSWTADPNAARQLRTVREAVRLLALIERPAEVFYDFGDERHSFSVALNTTFWWKARKPRPGT